MNIKAHRLFRASRTIGLFCALALPLSGCLTAFPSASLNGNSFESDSQLPAPQASPVVPVHPDHSGPAPQIATQIAQANEAPPPDAGKEDQNASEQDLDPDLQEENQNDPAGEDEDEALDPNYVPTN